ncbi:Uncharacterised protein [Streptococcus criceti]|uniref:Uncharacterized protein n=1 Tax=Streptococcus criceti HS-6 TaxID=873449 RepID=G5JSA4_STRCG|nr:hypothetical protein STRCR_0882 [Streptococcus criceti HS-6]SUN37466.1 Uncharacterised protein [Streptococcus criceti]
MMTWLSPTTNTHLISKANFLIVSKIVRTQATSLGMPLLIFEPKSQKSRYESGTDVYDGFPLTHK